MPSDTSKNPAVTRRRVFYIPGYDPIPPRRYRELFRSESMAQAEISGYQIGITAKTGDGPYGWQVDAVMDGARVRADVDVLVWSDIVQNSMDASILATYAQLVRTAWIYISTGTLGRLMRLRKGPVIAAFYPVGMLLLQLAIALTAFWITCKVTIEIMGLPAILGLILAGGLSWTLLRQFKAWDSRFFAYYLMHDYAFSAASYGANTPEMEQRIAEFTQTIVQAFSEEVDEVLVVGHSSGAHIAVSVLADLIRSGQVSKSGPKLAFLSLGHVVPMVSFLPNAFRLRADLHFLSAQEVVTWLDVSAPGDGCAFALCDPVSVSGVAPADKRWPLVISAAFSQTLSPARWKALRWRFFRLHFQYMCAFDQPRDYDYFQITAGPVTLQDRFDGRAASKSRIDQPHSKFTSLVP
ncbi:MAG: hypothetical protein WBC93_03000 [Sulfitobacter sp.]